MACMYENSSLDTGRSSALGDEEHSICSYLASSLFISRHVCLTGEEKQRPVGDRWSSLTEAVIHHGTLSKGKKQRAGIKLPSVVRSTLFAEFMLNDRFKVRRDELGPEVKLNHFPRFSRSNALVYFPSAMVSFMNNGDVASISALFDSFFHADCEVLMPTGQTGSAAQFLQFQHFMNEMHPDQIICVHSTREVNNCEIRADVYFKLAENRALHEAVARCARASSASTDPLLPFMDASSRAEHLKAKFNLCPQYTAEFEQLCAVLDAGADVELVGRIDMRLKFHRHTKRIHRFKMAVVLTEFRCFDILTQL